MVGEQFQLWKLMRAYESELVGRASARLFDSQGFSEIVHMARDRVPAVNILS